MTVSDYLRLPKQDSEERKEQYSSVVSTVLDYIKKAWSDSLYDVNGLYEHERLGNKLYGTKFQVEFDDDNSQELYKQLVKFNLNRDNIKELVADKLASGEVIPLGDALVIKGLVIINPTKDNFYEDSRAHTSISFNLILPEDFKELEGKEEELELKDKDNE